MKILNRYWWVVVPFGLMVWVSWSSGRMQERELPKNKEELGKLLFFDPILSVDGSISCASCHKPEFAFADTLAFSKGVKGGLTGRNTPSAMNMANRDHFFYDGRAKTLAEQALGPITNPAEMGSTLEGIVLKLNQHPVYSKAFAAIYKKNLNAEMVGDAIAAYEETLETGSTAFDRTMNGQEKGMSESAVRGRKLFIGKAKCFDCHFGVDFTRDEFKNIGLYNGKDLNDKGRYDFTKNEKDLGKFKVPGLRNVAVTAPYMHNGMFKSLEEVIEYYNDPSAVIGNSINRDSAIVSLNLSKEEKQDLLNFMIALTDDQFVRKGK